MLFAASLALPSAAAPMRYAAMMKTLKAADASGNVRVARIGTSVNGRAIPMAVIGKADAPVRVLAICRQHGNEPISTQAAMNLIGRAAHADAALRRALSGVLLLVIPMANPDGAERNRRVNARRVDLNRDWDRPSQPETKAVERIFHALRPQVVLDEHEWTSEDHIGTNSLECATPGALGHAVSLGALQAARRESVSLRTFLTRPGCDMRLAHRHFGTNGAAAFLLETTPDQPMAGRLALYERLTARIGRLSVNDAPEVDAPESAAFLAPMFGRPAAAKTARTPIPYSALAVSAATLILVLLLGRPRHRKPVAAPPSTQRVPLSEVTELSARLERRRALADARSS
ncbi:MAG TPA: M14 family zinc carboxypeptidase [Armatimonadota bacterium]